MIQSGSPTGILTKEIIKNKEKETFHKFLGLEFCLFTDNNILEDFY